MCTLDELLDILAFSHGRFLNTNPIGVQQLVSVLFLSGSPIHIIVDTWRVVKVGACPDQLPFAKFGDFYVLLHSGFGDMVLSENVVFFCANPLPTFKECTQGERSTWAS